MPEAIVPTDGMKITQDTVLAPGVYLLPKGISIEADGITLDCGGAMLVGSNREGRGISCVGRKGVAIRGAKLRDYYHGIYCEDSSDLLITENQVTSTAEVEGNTIFLDVWLPAEESYGGGVILHKVSDSRVINNDLQHQMNGLLTYSCSRLKVLANNASYNSGYGIHLHDTSDSLFEDNYADYCSRWNRRSQGVGHEQLGHMGADATGFLIMYNSCRNVFRRNFARLGGDGFFLAGLNPKGDKVPCNDNLFEENDGSLSPNIAFEATFSGGNVFRNNYADRCNYGFWLGFSWDNVIENNRMVHNRQAGIGVENGHGFVVRNNNFHSNAHGVLIWTKQVDAFVEAYPESITSFDWLIENNSFIRNNKGVRIAADQDHGIRPLPENQRGNPEQRPRDHVIRHNRFQDNRVGIELMQADKTVIENNTMNSNVEANIREDDTSESTIRNNLGAVGGYL